jgi:mannose/fructose/N-acetylgalactosamine-specific phosphotransferase system component IIB
MTNTEFSMDMEERQPSESCSLTTKFKMSKGGVVVVLQNVDDLKYGLSQNTGNGSPINYVTLGSIQHIELVSQRIAELSVMDRDAKLDKELKAKQLELQFLNANADVPEELPLGITESDFSCASGMSNY